MSSKLWAKEKRDLESQLDSKNQQIIQLQNQLANSEENTKKLERDKKLLATQESKARKEVTKYLNDFNKEKKEHENLKSRFKAGSVLNKENIALKERVRKQKVELDAQTKELAESRYNLEKTQEALENAQNIIAVNASGVNLSVTTDNIPIFTKRSKKTPDQDQNQDPDSGTSSPRRTKGPQISQRDFSTLLSQKVSDIEYEIQKLNMGCIACPTTNLLLTYVKDNKPVEAKQIAINLEQALSQKICFSADRSFHSIDGTIMADLGFLVNMLKSFKFAGEDCGEEGVEAENRGDDMAHNMAMDEAKANIHDAQESPRMPNPEQEATSSSHLLPTENDDFTETCSKLSDMSFETDNPKITEPDNDNECCICYETYDEFRIKNQFNCCSYHCCMKCYEKWGDTNANAKLTGGVSCPTCRTSVLDEGNFPTLGGD